MYLTAQHVRSKDQREGVNVYGYVHRGPGYSDIDWRSPDVVRIAEHEPGRLMFSIRALDGPGNVIRSYLDLVVSDELPAQTVKALLEAAAITWRPELTEATAVWSHGPMSLRFYVAASLRADVPSEFQVLKDELVLATASAVTPAPGAPELNAGTSEPIRVLRRRGPVSDRYVLDVASRTALSSVLPSAVTIPASLNVTHENREAFEHFLGGDLIAEIVRAFTHSTDDQLAALGGAIVLDEPTGTALWQSRSGQ